MSVRWDEVVTPAPSASRDASAAPVAPEGRNSPVAVRVRFFGMLLPSDMENPMILQFGSGCTLRDVVEELRRRLGSAFPCELIGENGELFNTCRVFVDGELLQNMSTAIFPRGSVSATLEIILLREIEGG
jgi:hypothetical protein